MVAMIQAASLLEQPTDETIICDRGQIVRRGILGGARNCWKWGIPLSLTAREAFRARLARRKVGACVGGGTGFVARTIVTMREVVVNDSRSVFCSGNL